MADNSSNDNNLNLNRRQAFAALGAGVVLVGGAAVASGAAATDITKRNSQGQIQDLTTQVNQLTQQHDDAQQQLAAAQTQLESAHQQLTTTQQQLATVQHQLDTTQNQLSANQLELNVYKGLIGLYETLDNIHIDSVIEGAIGTYKNTLDALSNGIEALRAGITTAQNTLTNFESDFGSIRAALDTAEKALANVGALLTNVQDLLKSATSPLLPFVDQAGKFFDDLLGKIPFGVGDSARQTINGIVGLVVAIPTSLDAVQNGLFRSLRENWFSDDNAHNLQATLTTPIINGVLQPATKFLDQADTTLAAWETQVTTPINAGLAQRKIVQQQIADYKQQHNL